MAGLPVQPKVAISYVIVNGTTCVLLITFLGSALKFAQRAMCLGYMVLEIKFCKKKQTVKNTRAIKDRPGNNNHIIY